MNFAVDTKFFARWEPCPDTIPENAVPGGKFTNGERLFIGRQVGCPLRKSKSFSLEKAYSENSK